MKVQILGTGCPKCHKLAENTQSAIDALALDCQIEKVTSIAEIGKFGVMFTPALAVDGQVKSSGKVLSPAEITTILTGAMG